MTTKNKIFLVLCFIFSGIAILSGADLKKYPEIKSYISNNIPINNQNWNISQNPKNGIMYFANSEGLVEYDGLQKKLYKLPYQRGVRSVCVDKSGIIFTGGFEEFGYWETDDNYNLHFNSLTKLVKVERNDEIWKIYCHNGKVYFQSFTTIYCYDYITVKAIKAPSILLFMFPMEKGFVVQVLGTGLFTLQDGKFKFIKGTEWFANEKVHAFIPYNKSAYLIGTANQGLFIYDGHQVRQFKCEISDFLKYNTCNAGVTVNDSLFMFGTILHGIVTCNIQGKIKNIFDFSNGLNNNTVLALFKDMDHGIWIGLDQGVNYVDLINPAVQYTNITGTLGTIYTLLKMKNELYIGSNQGLFITNFEKSEAQYIFSNMQMIPGSQGQVWTLGEFDDQIICGHNDGTFIVKNQRLQPISDITGGWSIKPFKNYLIEGTYTGLVLFKKDGKGNWIFRNKIKGFSEPTRHVEVDYLGYIWALHNQGGIYKIELNEKQDSAIKIDFFKDIDGISGNIDIFKINNRILFTNSEKIYTFDYDANQMIPLFLLNQNLGEYQQTIQIIPQQKKLYWFVLENKIALFDISLDFTAEKKFEINQKNIRSPGNDLVIIQMDDQDILLPNQQGLVLLNTKSTEGYDSPIRLNFSKLYFQGHTKTIVLRYGSKDLAKIPYSTNNLTVYFSEPSRYNTNGRIYYYRMPEIEDSWHSTTLNNFTYLNLRFGQYTIQIKPDRQGIIKECVFEILPPWYLTLTAFCCYFVLFGLLIYLGYFIFTNELKKQKKILEMEVKRNSLENELDFKSNELLLTMRYLIQKNEILTDLKNELDTLKKYYDKFPLKPIYGLEKIIRQGLDLQTENWKSAMNNLKLSQQGFFRRLKEKHSDLTPNDLRLCSYLSMNFTTKEIAHLLNISARGVEIGRYRLRKKMHLDHDINLSEYLMSENIGHLQEGINHMTSNNK